MIAVRSLTTIKDLPDQSFVDPTEFGARGSGSEVFDINKFVWSPSAARGAGIDRFVRLAIAPNNQFSTSFVVCRSLRFDNH